MKMLKLIICLSFVASKSYSCGNNEMVELYIRTLKSHLDSIEKNLSNEDEKRRFMNDTVYVICDSYYEIPKKIGYYNIKVIQEPYVSKGKNSISIFRLFPPKIEKGDLTIIVGEYTIYKGKEDEFIYNGGQSFSYRYDKFNQTYILVKTETLTF